MRPFRVIVLDELSHEVIEVVGAARREVIQAFLPQRPDEPLGALARLLTSGSIFSPVRTNALSG